LFSGYAHPIQDIRCQRRHYPSEELHGNSFSPSWPGHGHKYKKNWDNEMAQPGLATQEKQPLERAPSHRQRQPPVNQSPIWIGYLHHAQRKES
jgi:hypothetical protein